MRLLQGKTLSDVGDVFGFTRERARQVEGKAVAILRAALAYNPAARDLLGLPAIAAPAPIVPVIPAGAAPRVVRTLAGTLSSAEVAARAGVSIATIHSWMKRGAFPTPDKWSVHRWRWDEAEVGAWIAEHGRTAVPAVAAASTPGMPASEVPEPAVAPASGPQKASRQWRTGQARPCARFWRPP
jgi:predicted DNA-binding transcriptional regulator AlpA